MNWWSSSDNGKWNHIAYVSESSTVKKIYKNGVLRETITTGASSHYGYDENDIFIGRRSDGYYRDSGMKISNLRIVKGTAVYTGAFTPPTSPLTAISGTSLLTFQQHTGSPADRSGNSVPLSAVEAGTASTDTPFVPTFTVPTSDLAAITNTKLLAFTEKQPEYVTTGSTLFDGTNDNLSIPNIAMGTNNYTIEMWFYPTAISNYYHLYDGRGGHSSSQHATLIQLTNTGTLRFYSTSFRISGSDQAAVNTWNHVALERAGNVNTLYLNGVSQGTYDDGGTTYVGPANNVGRIASDDNGSGSFYPGYVSNFRIVKGSTAYTATSVSGGSTSFDGTGDHLVTASSSNLAIGTNDFTIEYWIYANNFDSVGTVWDNRNDGENVSMLSNISTSGEPRLYANAGYRITGTAMSVNTWNHIAFVRQSGTTTLYLNGVAQSTTYSDTTNFTGQRIFLGSEKDTTTEFDGYISNFRMVVGTAVYTSNFTPQNSALTAISNTKLLTCQNSTGAITDASSSNLTITANGNTAASTSKPFNDYFTVPTSNLTAITNTQILTCNDSNVINDASTSSHTITRNGDAVPTKFNPF